MITYQILPGSVDVSVTIRIVDSTDGTPETGVVFNTAGIDLQYRRTLAASTAITEATLAALTTAHTDGGFLHIGNGFYRLDLPDAAVATGVAECLVHGTVTGMVVIGCVIQLEGFVNSVYTRIGAPAGASASADIAAVKVDTAAILVDTGTTLDGRIPAALVGGRIDASVGAMAAGTVTAAAIATDAIDGDAIAASAVTEIQAGLSTLTAAQVNAEVDTALDTAIPAVNTAGSANDVLLDVVNARLLGTVAAGTHTAQSGDSFVRLGAPAGASVSVDIAAIEAQTDDIGVAGAGLTALGDTRIANLDAAVTTRATPAQVNTEVVDALNVDTYAEPGTGAPAATNTLVAKIGYLYKFLRNRMTQTATTLSVYGDDAVTVHHTVTVSDDGTTFDRGEAG